ncbi:MAG TPA: hypothetical protein VMN39_01170 [Longimicrobiaceae bacterium]|nr:hypothetical protein [Longimicrobiaceae bacterium]
MGPAPKDAPRPAGADNYLKWRRSIDEHLELRRLAWDEYGMFNWLCTKADPRTGRLRTSWPILAIQTGLTTNHVGKLCRALREKGYIACPEHQGNRRRLFEVAIDKFPLIDGTYTALGTRAPRGAGEVLAEVPAEVPAEVLAEVRPESAGTTGTSPGGRSRKRKRSRSTLRVRSADRRTGTEGSIPSDGVEPMPRDEALEVVPRVLRETIELFWLKTGRSGLRQDDLAALRELDRGHTPAVIQKAITEAVERFRSRGADPATLTWRYVWDSLRRYRTRTPAMAPTPPAASVYPSGLTRLN